MSRDQLNVAYDAVAESLSEASLPVPFVLKSLTTTFVGLTVAAVAGAGVGLWLDGEWAKQAVWPHTGGYDGKNFAGIFFFTVLATAGYALLYTGVASASRVVVFGRFATGARRVIAVAAVASLGLLSVALGLAALIVWAGKSYMSCMGAFCFNPSKYVHTLKEGIEQSKAFTGVVGMWICIPFVSFGLVLLWLAWSLARARSYSSDEEEAALAQEGAADGGGYPTTAAGVPHPADVSAVRRQRRRQSLWTGAYFVVAVLWVVMGFMCTAWVPNNWKKFTAYTIATWAKTPVADHTKTGMALYEECKSGKLCPELPWAVFRTRGMMVTPHTVMKMFPSNMFFYGYLLTALVGSFVVTHANRRLSRFWAHPLPPLPGWIPVMLRPKRLSRGELVGMIGTKLMLLFFFLYWVHDHNYIGRWDPTSPVDTIGHINIERWSRSFGQLAVALLGLLLFGSSRHSVMHRLMGTSWESFLWTHRWLGNGMLIATFMHMVLWWRRYHELGVFPQEILSVPTKMHPKNFTVALVTIPTFGLFIAMGVLALEPVRRRFFELFFYAHLWATWAIIPVVLLHAHASWEFMLPGLTVWLFDRVLRAARSAAAVRLVSASVIGTSAVELNFVPECAAVARARPGQYVFVNIPELSLFEWHPLTLSHCAEPQEGRLNNGDYLAVHVQSMGPGTWTDRLCQLVLKSKDAGQAMPAMTLAVDGPVGCECEPGAEVTHVVLLGGGIGITPCAAVFDSFKRRMQLLPSAEGDGPASSARELDENKLGKELLPGSRELHVVWVTRTPELLTQSALGTQVRTPADDRSGAEYGTTSSQVYCTRGDVLPSLPDAVGPHLKLCTSDDVDATKPSAPLSPSDGIPPTTILGRPDIAEVLSQLVPEPHRKTALVFVCGPEPLVDAASRWAHTQGAEFHTETFLL